MSKNKQFNGHGAWGMGHGLADSLAAVAASLAGSATRRLCALEGRPLSLATKDDLGAIYHSAAIVAWMRCGEVVAPSALKLRRKRGNVNPYSFQTRLAWCREIRKADKSARKEVYRTFKSERECATMADLIQWRDVQRGNWGEVTETVCFESGQLTEAGRGTRRPVSRREVRHSRECLAVYWKASGSRKAQAGHSNDRNLLAKLTRCARGKGFACLEISKNVNGSAVRKAIERLRQRIGEGDQLMTDQAEESDAALAIWKQSRQAGRRWQERQLAAVGE